MKVLAKTLLDLFPARIQLHIRGIYNRAKGRPDFFFPRIRGLIHVGANIGQERDNYAAHGLGVIWIEPIPEIFAVLRKHIAGYHEQEALNRLVTDKNGASYTFHVSTNDGASSSIYNLAGHRQMFPSINYAKNIELTSVTLDTLIQEERVDLDRYDALVLDTQGSELLILRGGRTVLNRMKYIKVEATDFELYEGCCQISEINEFLTGIGFRQCVAYPWRHMTGLGTCYDAVYVSRMKK